MLNCKVTRLLAISLLVAAAPFALWGCGDKSPSTADSAGKPAGWSGKQIKLPGVKNGPGGSAGGAPVPPTTH